MGDRLIMHEAILYDGAEFCNGTNPNLYNKFCGQYEEKNQTGPECEYFKTQRDGGHIEDRPGIPGLASGIIVRKS